MGQKDITEKVLEDYNDVFADLYSRHSSFCFTVPNSYLPVTP